MTIRNVEAVISPEAGESAEVSALPDTAATAGVSRTRSAGAWPGAGAPGGNGAGAATSTGGQAASGARATSTGGQAASGTRNIHLVGPAGCTGDFWFSGVLEQEGPGIVRLLWRLLGHEQDVLDAYQECWLLLAQLENPRDVRCVKSYVYRTASNIAVEMIRRRRRRQQHWPAVIERYGKRATDVSQASGQGAGRNGDARDSMGDGAEGFSDEFRQMIGQLPQHLRNVVVLRDITGMSYKELGRVLGIEPTTARVYRRQAILKLGEMMRQETSP